MSENRKPCMRAIVRCNRDGRYAPRQCVESACHCADENGAAIAGSEHASRNKSVDCPGMRAGVTCSAGKRYHLCQPKCPHSCPLLNHTCVNRADDEECRPGCFCPRGFLADSDGRCVRARSCGKAALRRAMKLRMEKARKAKMARMTPCRLQRASELKSCRQANVNMSRSVLKACNQNATACDRQGGYAARQCSSNHQCVCVDKEGGPLEGTGHAIRGKKRKNVDCLAARAGLTCSGGMRYHLCQPKCPHSCPQLNRTCVNHVDNGGCQPGCFCPRGSLVDSDGTCVRAKSCGKAALRRARILRMEKARKAKEAAMTPCRRQRASEVKSCRQPNVTRAALKACLQRATTCNRQGGYAAKQCSSNHQCVCVSKEGTLLQGTNHTTRGRNRKHVDCHAVRAGVVCPRGQRYHACQLKTCPRTCSHVRGENCSAIGEDVTCVAGCYCPKGQVLDGDVCVKATQKQCKLLTPCQRRRRTELRECAANPDPLSACNAIVCNKDGSFAAKQCYRLAELCHCVDEEGELILGSVHPTLDRRKVNCEEARST